MPRAYGRWVGGVKAKEMAGAYNPRFVGSAFAANSLTQIKPADRGAGPPKPFLSIMKQQPRRHRFRIAALSAAFLLPVSPLMGQVPLSAESAEQRVISFLDSLGISSGDVALYGPWAAGGALLLLALVAFAWVRRRRRRRAERDAYDARVAHAYDAYLGDRPADDEYLLDRPAEPGIAPARSAPATSAKMAVTEPDPADIAALAASSAPPAGRPWLEFFMRPIRAGTRGGDAVVQFALTVGNTGSAPARDVRISTWMFAAGSAQESEMERMLIEPPPGAGVSELDIPPGDAARVEGQLAVPREGLEGPILPVVVADARYSLPDGSEGRMAASFEVGRPAVAPLPFDRSAGLSEDVVSQLHGEPERV